MAQNQTAPLEQAGVAAALVVTRTPKPFRAPTLGSDTLTWGTPEPDDRAKNLLPVQ